MNPEDYDNYQMQSALGKEQIEAQTMSYAPQMYNEVQQQQAILVAQTNPKKIINEIILRLQGFEMQPDGTKVKTSEPMLNKLGIESLKFSLHGHINDNVRLSHLDAREISKRMRVIGNDLVDSLMLNFEKWGIKNKTHLDDINNVVLCNIFDILKRAEGQGEKNWLGKISVEQISGGMRMPMQKKEGFLSKFKL